MIQRIQSIWLIVAAVIMAILFIMPVYQLPIGDLKINDNFLAIILTALSIILSIGTIFMYKKRKNQISMIYLNILLAIGAEAWIYKMIEDEKSKNITEGLSNGNYWIGAFLPILTLIFLFLALKGVKKDEKLIKSLDRLR